MGSVIRRIVIFVCIFTLFLLVMGGGCGDKKQQQQDQQQKTKMKDDTLCQQCSAYDCEGCQAAPVCVKQCGCSQCGEGGTPIEINETVFGNGEVPFNNSDDGNETPTNTS